MTTRTRLLPIIGLLAVVLAACGVAAADQDAEVPTAPGIDVGEPHPDAPGGSGQDIPTSGMCLPDVPDCVDVVVDPVAPGHDADGRCLPEFPDCVDTSGPLEEPGTPSVDPGSVYRPIEPEGDVAGEGVVIGGGDLVSVDGNRITVGFWMGVEDCFAVERIDLAETETKVAVDITVAARDADQACIALAEARSVTVELDAPLGDRLLEIGGVTFHG